MGYAPPMRVAPRIILSDDERVRLTSWARGRSTPHRVVLRSRIVLRAAEGATNKTIAEELCTESNTCALWRRRFLAGRLQALMNDAPRAGGPLFVPDATVRAIVHATLHSKPPDATHWSTRSMAKVHGVSPSTVRRIWKARRLTPHRVEHYKLSRDRHFEEKLRDVVGLYLNPPEHALVLSVDEKTQIQALDRTQRVLPLRAGVPERQTHDYKRNGTTDLFAALNVAEGTVIGECHKRHRAKEFLLFLRTVDRSTPQELDLHLILDNLATHKTARVKRWVLRHPRFHFHFVPTSSSWLNQVERWFNNLTQKRIRRGVFHSERELIGALEQYVVTYNEDPRPFQWRATADQIIEKVRWNRLNVDLAGAPHYVVRDLKEAPGALLPRLHHGNRHVGRRVVRGCGRTRRCGRGRRRPRCRGRLRLVLLAPGRRRRGRLRHALAAELLARLPVGADRAGPPVPRHEGDLLPHMERGPAHGALPGPAGEAHASTPVWLFSFSFGPALGSACVPLVANMTGKGRARAIMAEAERKREGPGA